jgi:hypothetical protein
MTLDRRGEKEKENFKVWKFHQEKQKWLSRFQI